MRRKKITKISWEAESGLNFYFEHSVLDPMLQMISSAQDLILSSSPFLVCWSDSSISGATFKLSRTKLSTLKSTTWLLTHHRLHTLDIKVWSSAGRKQSLVPPIPSNQRVETYFTICFRFKFSSIFGFLLNQHFSILSLVVGKQIKLVIST